MNQRGKIWMVSALMAGLVAGCGEDPKVRIGMLEEQNQAMAMDLERLRNEVESANQQRDLVESSLFGLQEENDQLRNQFASQPTLGATGDWQSVPGGSMMALEGSVLFKPGRVTLKPKSKTILNSLASDIRMTYADNDIYVFGHTDSDPIRKSGWKDNRELSCQRSLAVVRYLQSQGIPGERLVSCGWGEHKPVAGNESIDGKSRNRRVVIFAADSAVVASR